MERTVLGRTGLEVSVAGLGCGGHSRLGQRQGKPVRDSIRIVKEAFDLGVNYFDTAQNYGTESIVGEALDGLQDQTVVSTKSQLRDDNNGLVDAKQMRRNVEQSLTHLRRDTIDVYHLHGVTAKDYPYAVSEILPELARLQDNGSIRYLAISERFGEDYKHEMLSQAVPDGHFDVVMVGFNIFNPTARLSILPEAIRKNIGIEVMFAVRRVLSDPDALREAAAHLLAEALVEPSALDADDPLGFLVHDNGPHSVVEAAYRFARHEPGCQVVLSGTGNIEHLRENIDSINGGPLRHADLARLEQLFGHLAEFSGD